MKKTLLIIKKTIKYFFIIFLVFAFIFLSQSVFENKKIQNNISDFIERGVYQESLSNDDIKYYKVPRETNKNYYRDKSAFYEYDEDNVNYNYAGNYGDIFIKLDAPNLNIFLNNKFLYDFITYTVGGHSAIISYDNKQIETNWNSPTVNGVQLTNNDWINSYNEIIGYRVKNASEDDYKSATNWALSKVDKKYNMNIFVNRNEKFYCSDLISRAWGYENESIRDKKYSLNQDGLPTTVIDLGASNDVYMFFYKYEDSDGVIHIYYLE